LKEFISCSRKKKKKKKPNDPISNRRLLWEFFWVSGVRHDVGWERSALGGGGGPKILTQFRNQTKQPPILDKQTYPNPNQNKNQSQAKPFMQINQK
jgi:hypothetical protein